MPASTRWPVLGVGVDWFLHARGRDVLGSKKQKNHQGVRPTRGDGPEGARASSRPSIPIPLPSSAHSPHRDTAHNAVLDRRHAALPLARGARGSRRAARAVGPCPPFLPRARSPRTRTPPPRSQRDRKLRRKPHPGTQTQTQCSAHSVRPPRHHHQSASSSARTFSGSWRGLLLRLLRLLPLARSIALTSSETVHFEHYCPCSSFWATVRRSVSHRCRRGPSSTCSTPSSPIPYRRDRRRVPTTPPSSTAAPRPRPQRPQR